MYGPQSPANNDSSESTVNQLIRVIILTGHQRLHCGHPVHSYTGPH